MKKGESMKNKIIKWSQRSYTAKQRLLFLMPESIIFLFLIPYAIFLLSKLIDDFLHLPSFSSGILTLFFWNCIRSFWSLVWDVERCYSIYKRKGNSSTFYANAKIDNPWPLFLLPKSNGFGNFYLLSWHRYYVGFSFIYCTGSSGDGSTSIIY